MSQIDIEHIKNYFLNKTQMSYLQEIAENPKPSLFIHAFNQGIEPSYLFSSEDDVKVGSKNEITFLQAYFATVDIKELEIEKDYFRENKNKKEFQSLLFLVGLMEPASQGAKKLEFLLNIGYDPNVVATEDMHLFSNTHTLMPLGLTPLYFHSNLKMVEALLKSGAKQDIKVNFVIDNNILPLIKAGHKKITSNSQLLEKNGYIETMFKRHNISMEHAKYHCQPYVIQQINKKLKLYYQPLNALELAKELKQKNKATLLQKYEPTTSFEERTKSIQALWEKGDKKNAWNNFVIEMRNDNTHLFEHLGEFKELIQYTQNKNNMVNQMVLHQKTQWLEKTFSLALVSPEFEGHSGFSYLMYAYVKNKPQAFIFLFEQNHQHKLEQVLNRIEQYLSFIPKDANPYENGYRENFSLLIIDYLIQKGFYIGGENTHFLQKAIAIEKEKIENSFEKETNITQKKRKI